MAVGSLAILDQTSDHLLGIEGGSLVPEIDIATDLAGLPEDGHVGKPVSVGQSPEWRFKTDGSDRAC